MDFLFMICTRLEDVTSLKFRDIQMTMNLHIGRVKQGK